MFARQTRLEVRLDRIDFTIDIFENSVVPAAKSQKGYLGADLLIDRKSGKAISITYWESEEDAIANEKNLYYQEQLIKILDSVTEPIIREMYEVIIKA